MANKNYKNGTTPKTGSVVSSNTKSTNVLTSHTSLPKSSTTTRKLDVEREKENERIRQQAKAEVQRNKKLKSEMSTYRTLKKTSSNEGDLNTLGVQTKSSSKANTEKQRLMKKYNVSSEEFDKEYNSYNSQKDTEGVRKNQKKSTDFTKNHKVLGSIASVGNGLLSTIEGVANTTALLQGGKLDTEKDYISTNKKEAQRKAVTDTIKSNVGKTAYNLGMGAADMAAQAAVAALTGGGGTVMGAMQGAQSAAESSKDSLRRGNSAQQAGLTGLGTGAISAGLSKFGVDDILGNKAGTLAGSILKGARNEALEEGAENLLGSAVDQGVSNLFGGKSAKDETIRNYTKQGISKEQAEELYKRDRRREVLQDAAAGALFGGALGGVNKVAPNIFANKTTNKQNNVPEKNANGLSMIEGQERLALPDKGNDIIYAQPPKPENIESISHNAPLLEDMGANNGSVIYGQDTKNSGVMTANEPKYNTLDERALINTRYDELINSEKIPGFSENWTNKYRELKAKQISGEKLSVKEQKIIDNIEGNTFTTAYEDVQNGYGTRQQIEFDEAPQTLSRKDLLLNPQNIGTKPNINSQKGGRYNGDMPINDTPVERIKPKTKYRDIRFPETMVESTPAETNINNVVTNATTPIQATPIQQNTRVDNAEITVTPNTVTPNKTNNVISNDVEISAPRDTVDVNLAKVKEGKSVTRLSKAYGTMKNGALQNMTEEMVNNVYGDKSEYTYKSRPEYQSFTEGMKKLNENPEKTIDSYVKNYNNIRSDLDIDAAMAGKQMLEKMYSDAIENGDTELANQLNEQMRGLKQSIRKAGTKYGQLINAFKKWASSDYEAVEMVAYDLLNATNEKRAKKGLEELTLSKETLAKVEDLYNQMKKYDINSKEHVDLESQAYSLIADEVCEPTFMDKWNTWRYFAMLSKPKTHIRNILGNQVFGGTERISDRIAGILEQNAIKKGKMSSAEATKSGKSLNKVILDKSKQYFNDYAYGIYNGSKYQEGSTRSNIEKNKKAFKSATLNKITDLNSNALEMEDVIAGKKAYSKAMTDFIQAKGYNESIFDADTEYRKLLAKDNSKLTDADKSRLESLKKQHEILNQASEYAMRRANEATFHDSNELAQSITETSKKLLNSDSKPKKALGMLIEGILPFKKTPMNILRQGVKYSPLQYAKVLSDVIGVKNGNVSRSAMYEDASKAITGTMYLLIGAYASSKGLLKGQATEGEKLEGIKDYSLLVGDKSIPIDFLAPGALPILAGASAYEKYKANNENVSFEDMFNVVTGLTDPLVETSMLDGLNDLLETIAYANTQAKQGNAPEGSEIASGLLKAGTSYVTQGIPGLLSSVAQTIDPVYRSARSTSTGKMGIIEQATRQSLNKIPGLSSSSPESVDKLGDTRRVGSNPLTAFFNSAINPTSINNVNKSEELEFINNLDKQGYSKSIITSAKSSAPIYNDELGKSENIRLTGREYEAAAKASGKTKSEALKELMQSNEFRSLTPELQESIIHNAYALGDKVGYEAAKPNEYTSEDDAFNIYKTEGLKSAIDYIVDDVSTKNKVSQINKEYGLSIDKSQYKEKLEDGTLDTYIEDAVNAKRMNEQYNLKLDSGDMETVRKNGYSPEEYAQMKSNIKLINEEYGLEDNGITMTDYKKAMKNGGIEALEQKAAIKSGVQILEEESGVEITPKQLEKWGNMGASKEDLVFMGNLTSNVNALKDSEGMSDDMATVAYLSSQNISNSDRSKYMLMNTTQKSWQTGYKSRGISTFGTSAAYQIVANREVAKEAYDFDGNGRLKQSEIKAFVDATYSEPQERAKWYYVLSGKKYK